MDDTATFFPTWHSIEEILLTFYILSGNEDTGDFVAHVAYVAYVCAVSKSSAVIENKENPYSCYWTMNSSIDRYWSMSIIIFF